ncbi:unnamed protein product [Trichogramma brassicae]|uniref:Uncharacterized protein n=1 Tax=Trichogramma brassicae TaxID=86971 RepID=A0A6H5IL23_9HYME|nr:unnamed protein product [Trichogramma brassicae]
MREKVNWEIEEQRRGFLRQFYDLINVWKGQLPHLRDIFRKEEIDWLLIEDVQSKENSLINFVAKTDYTDEPNVDENGKPLLRCTTALHTSNMYTVDDLFQIYNRFDVNYTNERGITHFHVACMYNRVDVIEKFLELGQDPNCLVPQTGDSPLHLVLRNGRDVVAKLLLNNGANPNSANKSGSTPLHRICQREDDDGLAEIFFDICDELNKRVQVDVRDKNNRTPLQWAVARLLPDTVDVLLDRGADLSSFVFPSESHFTKKLKPEFWDDHLKLSVVPCALDVIERLEKRGYQLNRRNALMIMNIFAYNVRLFQKPRDLDERWYDEENFKSRAKETMITPSLSLYDLIRLRPEEAEKAVKYSDYFAFQRISFQTRQQKTAITGRKRIHGALARQFQATFSRGLYFIQEHMLQESYENHKGELDEIAVEYVGTSGRTRETLIARASRTYTAMSISSSIKETPLTGLMQRERRGGHAVRSCSHRRRRCAAVPPVHIHSGSTPTTHIHTHTRAIMWRRAARAVQCRACCMKRKHTTQGSRTAFPAAAATADACLLCLFHAVRTINSTCAAAAQIPFYNARADDIIPSRSAATHNIYRRRSIGRIIYPKGLRLDVIRKIKKKEKKGNNKKNQARVRVNDFLDSLSPLGRGLNIHTKIERERECATYYAVCAVLRYYYARLRTHYVMAIMLQRRATSNDFLSPPARVRVCCGSWSSHSPTDTLQAASEASELRHHHHYYHHHHRRSLLCGSLSSVLVVYEWRCSGGADGSVLHSLLAYIAVAGLRYYICSSSRASAAAAAAAAVRAYPDLKLLMKSWNKEKSLKYFDSV